MVAPTVSAVGGTGGCKPGMGGGSAPLTSVNGLFRYNRLYLVIVVVTMGGKVDTAETGVGGDFGPHLTPKVMQDQQTTYYTAL